MAACDIWSGKRSFPSGMTSGLPTSRENEAFLVDGKALRLRQTLELKDRSGAIVATIRKRLLAVRDSMDIERGGTVIATVKKAVFSPLHHRSVVELPGGGELEAVGNITDKEFEIRSGGAVLAQVPGPATDGAVLAQPAQIRAGGDPDRDQQRWHPGIRRPAGTSGRRTRAAALLAGRH